MGKGSIRDKISGEELLRLLRDNLRVDWREYVALVAYETDGNPFAVLAAVVLSQNTNDKNSIRAYLKLRQTIGVTPEAILEASYDDLVEAIREAGLPRQKASALKALAEAVVRWGGENYLLKAPPEELREKLMSIRGIGPKTADVFLSLVRKAPGVFAVDTHAARVARRWGLVGEKAGYDEISKALYNYFGPGNSEEAHRLIIALGRTYCKARRPRCRECPLRSVCPSAQ
ncbi:endonuclease III [Aeropyrum pernix K1]|uniref:Endonuclease III n=1 Tax=Aeropyrum pernix (strain ATCC 700893 / DSM 11879 / JCM 9820 / NBRC 100138 / K1) TaxID=272557 RepID=Q9YFV0_AERPE|nr:endonuclease III [Aeropyrum pernix]BAA79061.2 endonuclease III [Aeropyrum pernix K1]